MAVKTEQEIEAMLDKSYEMKNFNGMTYKEGVQAALQWVLCQMESDEDPVS